MTFDHAEDGNSRFSVHAGTVSSDNASSISLPVSRSSQQSSTPTHSIDPNLEKSNTGGHLTDETLAQTISRRRSYASGHEGGEWAQIERLISRMFGEERKANSEEEKTRHVGVVWKGLTVKGVGLGAALQPTNGDIFMGLPRLIKRLLTRGRKGTGAGNSSIRTILDDFTVSVFYLE